MCARSSRAGSLAAGFASALLLASGCRREPATPPLFEGARGIVLDCVRTKTAPTQHELEALVRALVEAAGGATVLDRLCFHEVEDLWLARTDPMSNHALRETWLRHDLCIRTNLDYESSGREQRVMFRGRTWLSGRSLPLQPGSGGEQQYVEWDWEVATLPWQLQKALSLAPLPPREVDGRLLVGMQVDLDFNPKFEAWVDPAGPAIVEVVTDLPLTGDLALATHTSQRQRFSDFRRIDGLLVPFRREIFVQDRKSGLGEVRTFEVCEKLDDKVFLP